MPSPFSYLRTNPVLILTDAAASRCFDLTDTDISARIRASIDVKAAPKKMASPYEQKTRKFDTDVLRALLSLGRLRKDGLGIKPRHPAGGTGMVAKDAETSGRHCDPDGY